MRSIKFRAWDNVQNKMISWEILKGQVYNLLTNINGGSNWNYTQYTGLKDKNGVEIYEGDYLRWDNPDEDSYEIFEVFFIDGAFRYQELKTKHVEYLDNDSNSDFTVIGNIYQTPELLGK